MGGCGTEGREFCAAGLEYGKCGDDGSSPGGAGRLDRDPGAEDARILGDATVAAAGGLADCAAAGGLDAVDDQLENAVAGELFVVVVVLAVAVVDAAVAAAVVVAIDAE